MTPQQIAEVRPLLAGLPRRCMVTCRARISARAADRRAAQVDAADGGAAGCRSPAAAAVHHVLDLGLRGSAPECGAVVRRRPAGGGAGGRWHRVSQVRAGVAVRGPL